MAPTKRVILFWHPLYDLANKLPLWIKIIARIVTPTPFRKYACLRTALAGVKGFATLRAPLATRKELLQVHSAAYLNGLEQHAKDGILRASWNIHNGHSDYLDNDCVPFNKEVLEFFKASVGGTCAALKHAYATGGITVNLSGGFHHATRARGTGFCVFNDVAIAVKTLRKRTMIIDLDVHHGDGTAKILKGDPKAFTFSMHQRNGYPDKRPKGSFDVPLKRGIDDNGYLDKLLKWLPWCLDLFKPEAVIYIAGADPLATDKLGLLGLTLAGLRTRDRLVFALCRDRKLPMAVVLGGGYSDLETTVEAHEGTCREARAAIL